MPPREDNKLPILILIRTGQRWKLLRSGELASKVTVVAWILIIKLIEIKESPCY